MNRVSRPPMLPRAAQPIVGFAVGAAGAAVLSLLTSQGYLHATVVTGAGYTGTTAPLGPGEQLLMLFAWILIGALAGWTGRTGIAFAGLWIGALAGSVVGFLADPDGNILWLDLIVTIVGITLFLTPGFLIGSTVAGQREGLAPDGSGHRPAPPPLWTRGVRRFPGTPMTEGEAAGRTRPVPTSGPNPSAASYAPSSYARPGSTTRE